MSISATLGLSPEVDDSAAKEARETVEEKIGDLEFGKSAGGAIGAQIGGQIGGGPGSVVGQSLGEGLATISQLGGTGGLLGGAALAMLSTIATGVTILADASPTLEKSLGIISETVQLALRPLGRALGQTILPFAKDGLRMAGKLNKIASEDGLDVAISETLFANQEESLKTIASTLISGFSGASVAGIIGALIGSVIPGVGTAVGGVVGSALGGAVGSIIGAFTLRNTELVNTVMSSFQSIADIFVEFSNSLTSLLGDVKDILKSISQGITNTINEITSLPGNIAKNLSGSIPGIDFGGGGGNSGGGGGGGGGGGDGFLGGILPFGTESIGQKGVSPFERASGDIGLGNDNENVVELLRELIKVAREGNDNQAPLSSREDDDLGSNTDRRFTGV